MLHFLAHNNNPRSRAYIFFFSAFTPGRENDHAWCLGDDAGVSLPAALLLEVLQVGELSGRDLHPHVRHGLAAPLDCRAEGVPRGG